MKRSIFTIVNVTVLFSSISILAYATTLSATHTGIHIHEPFQNLQALTETIDLFPGQQGIANFTVVDAGPIPITVQATCSVTPSGQGVTSTMTVFGGSGSSGTITLTSGSNTIPVTVIASSSALAGNYNVTLVMTRV